MRIVVKNLPLTLKESDLRTSFTPFGHITDIFMVKRHDGTFKGVSFIGFSTEKEAKSAIKIKDGTYIKNQKITVESESKETYASKKQKLITLTSNTESTYIPRGNIIEVLNLPSEISEKELKVHFTKYGNIRSLSIEREGIKTKCRITFADSESVSKTLVEKKDIMGRRPVIFEPKEESEKSYFNSLFFDFKTVIEKICEEEKITKRDLVDLQGGDLGTRISLLETHLIEETRKFLETNGIFLDNLSSGRNKRILIMRNYNLLNHSFKCKVSIAPSKTLALLFFNSEESAEKTFNKYNYMRIRNKAIHCEYLPLSKATEEQPLKFTNKLVVKNVPFQATKYEIRKLFESQVRVKEIRLPMKNEEQHRGFCFVTFESEKEARTIYEYFGGNTHLYGRRLNIEIGE